MRNIVVVLNIVILALIVAACRMEGEHSTGTTDQGGIETLHAGPDIPEMMEVDANYLFWMSSGRTEGYGRPSMELRIMRMSKDGSNLAELAMEPNWPWAMTSDSAYIYWISPSGIKKVAKEGGAIIPLVKFSAPSDWTESVLLAADETAVYWANCEEQSLWRASQTIGVPERLLEGFCPTGLATSDQYLYVADGSLRNGRILQVNKDGSDVVELAINQDGPFDLQLDKETLYWINANDPQHHGEYAHRAIMAMPIEGTPPTKLASVNIPDNLFIKDHFAYWQSSVGIQRTSLEGGEAQTLATLHNTIADIAVDETNLYFTISSEQSVYRIAITQKEGTE